MWPAWCPSPPPTCNLPSLLSSASFSSNIVIHDFSDLCFTQGDIFTIFGSDIAILPPACLLHHLLRILGQLYIATPVHVTRLVFQIVSEMDSLCLVVW